MESEISLSTSPPLVCAGRYFRPNSPRAVAKKGTSSKKDPCKIRENQIFSEKEFSFSRASSRKILPEKGNHQPSETGLQARRVPEIVARKGSSMSLSTAQNTQADKPGTKSCETCGRVGPPSLFVASLCLPCNRKIERTQQVEAIQSHYRDRPIT